MNALVLIVALLGAEPNRQMMLDETLDFIYTVEGSEAHNLAETRFQKLSENELRQVYADYKIIRQEIRDLYAQRSTPTPPVYIPPPEPTYTPQQTESYTPPVKSDKQKADGWTTYIGPRGHTVYVAPIVTEPGLCDGTSARSIDWWRVEHDPNYQHPALEREYVKGQGYQYRTKCKDGTCPNIRSD